MGHWGYVALAWGGGLLALAWLIVVSFAAARKARAELEARDERQ